MKELARRRTRRPLRAVDADYQTKRRAYVLGFDATEFRQDVDALEQKGWIVVNADEDRLIDDVDLRLHLMALTCADDLVLPSIWWTSAVAHQLVTAAGWMRIRFITPDGATIETTKGKF